MYYWEATVSINVEDDKGKVKKERHTYLIQANSPTECDTNIHKFMESTIHDWEIVSCKQSKIGEIITYEDIKANI